MEKTLNAILEELIGLKSAVSNIKSEITDLKSEVSNLKSEVENIKNTLSEHGALLKAIEHRVEENTVSITALGESMDQVKGQLARQEMLSKSLLKSRDSLMRRQNELELEILDIREQVEG